jgi:hypothetical protein
MTMTREERMQRESSLIATARKQLPGFAKACADDTELWPPWKGSARDWKESEPFRRSEIMEDIPKYTTSEPLIQIGEVKL